MNTGLVFRLILAFLFILVIGTRRFFERRAARTAGEGIQQDRDLPTLIMVESLLLTLSNLGLIVYLIRPSWMAWSTIALPDWVRWIGVVLGLAGAALLVWTHVVLGSNFFGGVKTREGHELVKAGPYRRVRHPMYTAFVTIGLAWSFLSGNWFIAGLWLAATILVLVTRVKQEEQMMLQQFGEEYRSYQQQTGRFLPRLIPASRSENSGP